MTNNVDKVNHSSEQARPERPGEDIAEEIHAIRHLFKRRRYQDQRLGDRELTHMEARVIFFVGNNPGASQSEAVAHFGRDKAQIARLIGNLRRAQLIETEADAQDKRLHRMTLTTRGASVAEAAKHERRRLAALAVSGLNSEEQTALTHLLARIRQNLEAEESPQD